MQILLITTLPNKIHNHLQRKEGVNLKVVDCSQFVLKEKEYRAFSAIKNAVLSAIHDYIDEGGVDMIITYRCPFILPLDIFEHTTKGAYNIHPSLLPKYPGANPWKDIYDNNEHVSGVTLHVIDKGVDSGKILFQYKFEMDLEKDIKYHQKIVEEHACKMIDDLLFA